ncbi:MAG: DUF362 domain-containing protein [Acidobacteria bacterium]|nr:DUF362 domain-containing protein [Acidobacteriota bacterium]
MSQKTDKPEQLSAQEQITKINRRQLIKGLATTGIVATGSALGMASLWDRKGDAGLQGPPPLLLPNFTVEPASASSPKMAIAHGSSPMQLIKAAVGELGGFEHFIKKGDIVVIKPNVAFDRAPILGATTNPEVVYAVVKYCFEAGAKEVRVADNPINAPEGAFYKTGIRDATLKAGAKLFLPETNSFEDLTITSDPQKPSYAIKKPWPFFYKPFARATKVIGVAPLKDHNLCHASMTIKNWYGLLGGRRNRFHQDIHNIVYDLALMMKPTLVILDATRILMSNGPTGGRMSDVVDGNTVIAGTDPVCVDAYGYTLLGRDPEKLTYLLYAHERGAGNRNWKQQNFREITI